MDTITAERLVIDSHAEQFDCTDCTTDGDILDHVCQTIRLPEQPAVGAYPLQPTGDDELDTAYRVVLTPPPPKHVGESSTRTHPVTVTWCSPPRKRTRNLSRGNSQPPTWKTAAEPPKQSPQTNTVLRTTTPAKLPKKQLQ